MMLELQIICRPLIMSPNKLRSCQETTNTHQSRLVGRLFSWNRCRLRGWFFGWNPRRPFTWLLCGRRLVIEQANKTKKWSAQLDSMNTNISTDSQSITTFQFISQTLTSVTGLPVIPPPKLGLGLANSTPNPSNASVIVPQTYLK